MKIKIEEYRTVQREGIKYKVLVLVYNIYEALRAK